MNFVNFSQLIIETNKMLFVVCDFDVSLNLHLCSRLKVKHRRLSLIFVSAISGLLVKRRRLLRLVNSKFYGRQIYVIHTRVSSLGVSF